jgi:hypothetical protein
MPFALVRLLVTRIGLGSVVGWAPAAPVAREQPDVVLWPASPELADDLPTRIDARFELQPREPLLRELADARAAELARKKEELAKIERGLAEAREAFVAQRFADMEAGLVGLQRDHSKLLADPINCGTLWEVQFRLGLAYQFRGNEGDRERMQARYLFALALDGERRPPREVYGPDVLAAFLAAVDARTGLVAQPLQLGARPRDAELYVDCRAAASGRIELVEGLHVVYASAPGRVAHAMFADTHDMSAIELNLAPHPDDDPIVRFGATSDNGKIDPKSASARRSLVAATTRSGAEVTVLAWRSEGRAAARALVGKADGPVIVRDAFDAAVAAVLAGIDDDGKLRATPAVVKDRPADTEPKKRRPVARTWWFWTIIGTVVVGSVALAVGLTVPKRPSDRLVITGPR